MKMKEEVKQALEVVHELWNSAEDFSREVSVLNNEASELLRLIGCGNWHKFGEAVQTVRERAQVTLACIDELADKAGVEHS
jgi:hypothetical protein